ncbi:26S proteasome complex subunit [Purpureocillium takamizusanense]|uniref:26S proteasome complex subunit SEM1 n=1 Tax=Purpureocillium takamizusanense TaxID=2060973 RepID=A0A9Q8QR20_9HYPO|nr:26S proteasome complex subunit [Purpureocillium takamizusanense]UNI23741.1 26S proteasome complex subunit [Purpureocillium takamizusanense]
MASTDAKPAEDASKAQSETQGQLPAEQQKPTSTALGEDDEFEDFPVDDWPEDQTEAAQQGGNGEAKHLWEESWDDDDTSDDFSQQLKYAPARPRPHLIIPVPLTLALLPAPMRCPSDTRSETPLFPHLPPFSAMHGMMLTLLRFLSAREELKKVDAAKRR